MLKTWQFLKLGADVITRQRDSRKANSKDVGNLLGDVEKMEGYNCSGGWRDGELVGLRVL